MTTLAFFRTALTGGGVTALDNIDGSLLSDGDFALCMVSGEFLVYALDADSALAESSPHIISPDDNAGDKRWIQQSVPWSSDAGTMFLSSNLVKDIKYCPWTAADETMIGPGSFDATPRIVRNALSGAAAWTLLANWGAVSQVTVDDTYATILDIASGAGFMYSLVLPGVTAIGDVVTVKATIDGVEYTQAFTMTTATQRVVMGQVDGKCVDNLWTPTLWDGSGWVGIAADMKTMTGSMSNGAGYQMVHPVNFTAPVVRYETSLKIEMKSSDFSTTNNRDDCAVIYRAD